MSASAAASTGVACHQAILTEGFLVEEDALLQSPQCLVIGAFRGCGAEFFRIDAQLIHQSVRLFAVRKRRFDGPGAAIREQQPALRAKLVALGVAAEIVVIVENQDARCGAGAGSIKVGRGEAADAAAYDD